MNAPTKKHMHATATVGMTVARKRIRSDCGSGCILGVNATVGFVSDMLQGPSITGADIGTNSDGKRWMKSNVKAELV